MMILNFLVFGTLFLQASEKFIQAIVIAGLFINAIPVIYFLLNKKQLRSPFTEISFFLSAIIWLLIGNMLFAALMVLICVMSFFTNKELIAVINAEGISYPSFPVKKYEWHEVDQVILKDDIVTIDLKNNKLIQLTLNKEDSKRIDEKDFNASCLRWVSETT